MNEEVLIIISTSIIILMVVIILFKSLRGRHENIRLDTPSYIVFTTIPSRLRTQWFKENLSRRIKLAGNSVVVLNVPYKSLKGEDYIIPDEVSSLQGPNFMILRCPKDLGPITKIIPILETVTIPDRAIIMVCDDDIRYRSATFSLLKESIIKNPDAISSMCDDKITGYTGYGFIKKTMKGLTSLDIPKACQRIDDDVIQQYVKYHKIKVVVVKYPGHFTGLQTDSLGNYGWAGCSGYTTSIEPHPEWEELRSDNRTEIRKNCIPLLRKNLAMK